MLTSDLKQGPSAPQGAESSKEDAEPHHSGKHMFKRVKPVGLWPRKKL